MIRYLPLVAFAGCIFYDSFDGSEACERLDGAPPDAADADVRLACVSEFEADCGAPPTYALATQEQLDALCSSCNGCSPVCSVNPMECDEDTDPDGIPTVIVSCGSMCK